MLVFAQIIAAFLLLFFNFQALSLEPSPQDTNQSSSIITEGPPPKVSYLVNPAIKSWIEKGHREYYAGHLEQAITDYEHAVQEVPTAVEAWLNGGAVWEERGNPEKAAEWFSKASLLAPGDPKILTDLGWADFHRRDWASAESRFAAALAVDSHQLYALLGMGRVRMAQDRAGESIPYFDQATVEKPVPTIAFLWKGQAMEQLGDLSGAADAYRRATNNDSYVLEARNALAMTFLRSKRFAEAIPVFNRILAIDSDNRQAREFLSKMRSLVQPRSTGEEPHIWGSYPHQLEFMMPQYGHIPTLRVGIGTNDMGHPLPRTGVDFESTTPFSIIDAKTNHRIASGQAREQWHIHFAPQKPGQIKVLDSNGRPVLSTRKAFVIRPDIERGGSVVLYELPYVPGYHGNTTRERHLRGKIEISLHPNRRAFKIVNIVDLETYTHGVLSAEMPITSPLEALKVQSVVARSHALYIKTRTHLHRRDGYDLCDGQHCQVYLGVQAETERSRAVVNDTRGRIAAYKGQVAHVIYSSNCGGHTQSGAELNGWGKVPYWKAVKDMAPGSVAYPHSPWELHWWLRTEPAAYCMTSSYVYPAHYRWTRYVSAQELEARINRSKKIGHIVSILALRRAVSGHINLVRIVGTNKKDYTIKDESKIRNLLAPGSQRSALFFMETEYGPDHKPSAFVFHGAGWGHGVGMCQSGAAGRAEQGALYEDILKAYYPGIDIGNLKY